MRSDLLPAWETLKRAEGRELWQVRGAGDEVCRGRSGDRKAAGGG